MDAHTFDRWTTALSQHPTRRTALRFLAGGLLSGLLAQQGARSARAAQPGVVEQVPGADVLVSCADLGLEDCAGICCTSEETCIDGYCQGIVMQPEIDVALTCLDASQTDCGGVCVDLTTHADHCGRCFFKCEGGSKCQGGFCRTAQCGGADALTAGMTDCGVWHCVDLASDASHCGACFNLCPLGGFCQGGVCTGLICTDGLIDCDTGYCVDLWSDGSHCGGCFNSCPLGSFCQGGVCM